MDGANRETQRITSGQVLNSSLSKAWENYHFDKTYNPYPESRLGGILAWERNRVAGFVIARQALAHEITVATIPNLFQVRYFDESGAIEGAFFAAADSTDVEPPLNGRKPSWPVHNELSWLFLAEPLDAEAAVNTQQFVRAHELGRVASIDREGLAA
jgi:hypothetical protein